MATIILRQAGSIVSPGSSVKGTPLTNLEVDNNFSNINIEIGVLSDLTTSGKANLVVAVNELDSNVGSLAVLTTTAKGNLVAAINEVKATTVDQTNVNITGGSITGITDLAVADGGTGASDAATARTNLGLGAIALQSNASVNITGGTITGITDLAIADGGTGASSATNARWNLGLGTVATQNTNAVAFTGGSITGITDLAVADGGTGASDAGTARTNLGLVIGTHVQAYSTELAALASPSSTGILARTTTNTYAQRSIAVSGTGISITNGNGVSGDPTISSNATNNNTGSTLVARDASGNFSANVISVSELRSTGDVTAYYTSDIRLKENIKTLPNSLSSVLSLSGIEFDWTNEYLVSKGPEDGIFIRKNDVGVIAQEVKKVLPQAVIVRDNGYMGVRYEKIIPLLIEAIKELNNKIETLQNSRS